MGIESLTLEGGGSVEDLDLDFTLPGCSDIELKVRGLPVKSVFQRPFTSQLVARETVLCL